MNFDSLELKFSFSDPFADEKTNLWSAIGTAKAQGIMSTETAVELLGVADDKKEEIQRIKRDNIQNDLGTE